MASTTPKEPKGENEPKHIIICQVTAHSASKT